METCEFTTKEETESSVTKIIKDLNRAIETKFREIGKGPKDLVELLKPTQNKSYAEISMWLRQYFCDHQIVKVESDQHSVSITDRNIGYLISKAEEIYNQPIKSL